mgnify:CR=1 FL=1
MGVNGVGIPSRVLVESLGEFVLPRSFSLWDGKRVGREEPAPRQA